MALACPIPDAATPLLQGLTSYLICHEETLGEAGAQSVTGSFLLPALLTGCLTIYVALIGYRLLLGQTFGVRDAILAAVRVGLVIAFCTRWTSYEAVIYKTVAEGPAEVASLVLRSTDITVLPLDETAQRLEAVYDAIQKQTHTPLVAPLALPPPGAAPTSPAPLHASAPTASTPSPTVSNAGLLFMLSTVGVLLAIRLVAAILLAVGPLIIVLALFDGFIGVFEGWIRALLAIGLGGMGSLILVALELAFVEAEVAGASVDVNPLNDRGLMIVASFFALAIVGVVVGAGLVAKGFKLPAWRRHFTPSATISSSSSVQAASDRRGVVAATLPETSSRARAVADAVTTQGRRERDNPMTLASPNSPGAPTSRIVSGNLRDLPGAQPRTLGNSFRRSPAARRSALRTRREGQR